MLDETLTVLDVEHIDVSCPVDLRDPSELVRAQLSGLESGCHSRMFSPQQDSRAGRFGDLCGASTEPVTHSRTSVAPQTRVPADPSRGYAVSRRTASAREVIIACSGWAEVVRLLDVLPPALVVDVRHDLADCRHEGNATPGGATLFRDWD
jgi:hypothetical protein